jgi:hypothetical protein
MSTISSGTTLTTALVQTGDTTGDLVIKTGSSNTTAMTVSGSNQSVTFAGAVNVASSAFANGSAASPSITFTGDTNTGIFSPAADTIAFSEGGAEIARFDSSGNLGIGTTSVGMGFHVVKNWTSGAATVGAQSVTAFASGGEAGYGTFDSNGTRHAYFSSADTATRIWVNTTKPLVFGTDAVERMRIDSSGTVGIGTTTMTRNLNVGNSTNAVGIGFQNTGTSGKNWSIFSTNAGSSIGGGNLGFYNDTDTAYRMILDGTGNLQFNSGYGSVATAYGCRAWVNFNGTGTVAIRNQGNVSSITDNGTGDYTVNFTTAMPDANYCVHLTADFAQQMVKSAATFGASGTNPTASAVRVFTRDGSSSASDATYVYVAITR